MNKFASENVKDVFKEMCAEIFPLLEGVSNILDKYGVENMASIAMSHDGYMNFSVHDEPWSLLRLDREEKPKVRYEYEEMIEL